MTMAIRRTSVRQMLSLSKYDLPAEFFEAGILIKRGGSTHLNKKGSYFEARFEWHLQQSSSILVPVFLASSERRS